MFNKHVAFMYILCCASLYGMEQQPPLAKKQNGCLRGLSKLYEATAAVFRYPFKVIGSATVDGAVENLKARLAHRQPVVQQGVVLVPGSVQAQDDDMKEIVGSFFKALSVATNPKDKDAAGAQFMKNLFQNGAIAIGDLYNPDGEGRRALTKIITTFKDYINDDGVIKALIEDARTLAVDEVKLLFERFEELNLDGGAAKRAVNAASQNVRAGVRNVGEEVDATSKKVVQNVLVGGVLLISSWFLWKHIDRNWRTPALVLETSYKNSFQRLTGFLFGAPQKAKPQMIMAPELKQRLEGIALAVQAIHEKIQAGHKNIRYRNLLLWGPPGTGKTMFARLLAEYSGMDYAIMSGSSFSQYRRGEGISQMNKLFEWAQDAPTGGLILFIDECEAFLGRREDTDIFSDAYQLLTNFLNLTGERSDKVMIVFCTNHPKVLDEAMKRRIDDSIELPLPAFQERLDILKLYRDMLMLDSRHSTADFMDAVREHLSDETLSEVASRTEGLSGGELEGIINSLISDAAIQPQGLLTAPLVQEVIRHAVEKHTSFVQGFAQVAG